MSKSNGEAKPSQIRKTHFGYSKLLILQVCHFSHKAILLKSKLLKRGIAYYLPPASITIPLIRSTHSSFCEWKGRATYYNLKSPDGGEEVKNRAWSYASPTKGFEALKGYVSFYAGPWDCYVDGEKVEPQPGDFYGGWVTSDIEGKVKGGPGTWGW